MSVQRLLTSALKNIQDREGTPNGRAVLELALRSITLDKVGMEMLDTLLDFQTGNGARLAKALVSLSYAPPQCDTPCEVKESTFGRGVFATRDVKAGDIITLYPVHLYLSPPKVMKNGVWRCDKQFGGVEYDSHYCLTHSPTGCLYQGDKDRADPLFLGHLINDFYPTVEDFQDKKNLGATMLKYAIYGITHQNVEFVMGKHLIAIKASKDIKAGDEFLIAYCPTYWANLSISEVSDTMSDYILSVSKKDPKKGAFLGEKMMEYFKFRDGL
jgi:hypothetical protein